MRTLFIVFSLFLCTALSAQQHPRQQPKGNGQPERKEFSPEAFNRQMEQFITDRAGLTSEEAKAFYPLMHEMLAKQRTNNEQQRQLMEKCGPSATERDYEEAIMRSLELEQENKRIEQTYYKRFHDVLSWEKIHKVKSALVDFQMEALRRFAPPQQQQKPNKPVDFRRWQ